MFTIISIMFVGIGIGYVLRNLQFLQKIEKSTSLTIFLLPFDNDSRFLMISQISGDALHIGQL